MRWKGLVKRWSLVISTLALVGATTFFFFLAPLRASTIWSSSTVPGLASVPDGNSIEVGVKFQSENVNGYITGLRFYKGPANTGTHIGNLWTSTGTPLASATFTGETATGWQQVNFATPVPITANTMYVASYHTDVGGFAADAFYFNTSFYNAPLRALADGSSGGNGVYQYGPSSFPTNSFNANNYWVDVVFSTTAALTMTTTSLPSGTTGVAYNTTLAAFGGTPPYTWSVVAGTLPGGLALSSSGALSGTPTAAGTSNFTVQVSDSAAQRVSRPFTISVAWLTITTTSLPNAELGVAYNAAVLVVGGTPPYTWTLLSGSLPPVLSLSTSGTISGTPTTTGLFTFTLQVSDSAGHQVTQSYTITTTSSTSLWNASVVPGTPSASDGAAIEVGVKFTSDVNGFITGVRFYKGPLNTGTHIGHLWTTTGTPLASATFTGETATGWQTVTFATPVAIALNTTYVASYHSDVGGYAADASYFTTAFNNPPLHALADGAGGGNGLYDYGADVFPTSSFGATNYWVDVVFSATPPVPSITTTSLPNGIQGVAYNATLAATGGTPPYTWSLASGSNLPAGLSLSTSGTISGAPTTAGPYSFTVKVTDSGSQQASRGFAVSVVAPLVITTASLPNGTVGTASSATLVASGGTPPYTWSLATGSNLPPGLSLSASGTISGTPTAAGLYSFTIQVTDSSQVATRGFTVSISPAALTITTTSLPSGTVGIAYSATLVASGGTPPYTWGLATGSNLPPGLSLSASGTISGTPTGTGSFSFTIQVRDSASQQASQGYTVSIGNLAITTTTLPNGIVGVSYNATLAASGGTPPYTWSLATGSNLPPGLSLGASGTISGTPTTSGPYSFTIQVRDSGLQQASRAFNVTIVSALSITTTSVPNGTVGVAYSVALAASGGTLPYTWSLVVGSLPTGLTLSTSSGTISGTPTGTGSSSFTVKVADSGAQSATQPLTLTVVSVPPGPPILIVSNSSTSNFPTQSSNATNYWTDVVFSTVASGGSIWNSSALPAEAASSDGAAIEVGVKFTSDVSGYITGLRFYKGLTNTGTHVGHLWTSTGTLLKSATFTGETPQGWQTVMFSSPVAISAGTTYVASYHTDVGGYSDTTSYFTTAFDNPPLHALADAAGGGNGVYQYGPSSFPNNSFISTNYWVDVVFSTTSAARSIWNPTATPTQVSASDRNSADVGVKFRSDVNGYIAGLRYYKGAPNNGVHVGKLWSSTGNLLGTTIFTGENLTGWQEASFSPPIPINANTTYVASYHTDVGGYAADPSYFTSSSVYNPPLRALANGTDGSNGVFGRGFSPFGPYYAEVLRAEGVNAFSTADLSSVSAATLAPYDIVILGETPLTDAQVTMFTNWVTGGGKLIAMRPDKKLASLLGLSDASSTLSNAYLLVNTATPPGLGIVGLPIQFHGSADLYNLNGANSLATLYSNASTATPYPAVTLRSVGGNGGQAAAFTFDLARSIVYTRQGNPAWAGQERDGIVPIRSDDMYWGPAVGDPQPFWVDFNNIAIPQADEEQRFLVNLIETMNQNRRPLPRFWYFPRGKKAVVVMTGDDHANGGTVGRFNQYLSNSAVGCSVANWECIRSTSYIYNPDPGLSDSLAASYNAQGFEIALHVTTSADNWPSAAWLDGQYFIQRLSWSASYPSLPPPVSNRTHWAVWSDWVNQALIELKYGIRLDTTYYYYPFYDQGPGFFTGSGMPMRFANLDGTVIDVYQATTQLLDHVDGAQPYPSTIDAMLNAALGPAGYYGAFTANCHTDIATSDVSDAIVASAQAHGVSIVSARQMLTWLDGRNGSSFGSLAYSGNTLSFTITVGVGANGLQAMVPSSSASGTLKSITLNGSPITYSTQSIKGISYAIFAASPGPGSYAATYGP